MRFGSISRITRDGDTLTEEVEKIHEFATRHREVRYSRSIIARSDKDALAECLKLFDQLKLPETVSIAFSCDRMSTSGSYRLEATVTQKELH